jgi:pimeloyl-ACP methyl ester carboxylesterase
MRSVVDSIMDTDAFNARVFFPRAKVTPTPPGAQDIIVPCGDAQVHVRIHAADPALPWLLLFHGNGEVVSDYDGKASTYEAVGVRLVVAEYRGYGQSTGTPSMRVMIGDALDVFAEVHARAQTPIFVMGRSLGSMSALQVAGHSQRTQLRGIVIESGFVDVAGFVARRGPGWLSRIAASTLEVYDGRRKLARTDAPVLVLHGSDDDMIVPAEAEATYAAVVSPVKHLVFVPGRGHNDVDEAAAYWTALQDFVRACA